MAGQSYLTDDLVQPKALHLDLLAMRRHLLTQMGIDLWAKHSKPAQTISYPSRFDETLANTMPVDEASTNDSQANNQTSHQSNQQNQLEYATQTKLEPVQFDKPKPSTQAPSPIQPSNTSSQPSTQPTINHQTAHSTDLNRPVAPQLALPKCLVGVGVSVNKFALVGMRYRRFVLLADEAFLNTATKGVWLSLQQALYKQSQNSTVQPLLSLSTHYPLVSDDYPQYQHFEQGGSVLLGFLLRLCANDDNELLQLLPLSPISQGIDLGGLKQLYHAVPTLEQMLIDPNLKKQFWQYLHG